MRKRRLLGLVLAFSVAVASCGGDGAAATTTTESVATTSTTLPPTTTTEPSTTTTMLPQLLNVAIDVAMEGDDGAAEAVRALYAWIGDRTMPTPDAPAGLLDLLADIHPESGETVEAVLHASSVDGGAVGVVTAGDDLVLLADEGAGWRVVGAHLARFGVAPWYGGNVRHVMILGTDKDTGRFQPVYRADSIHILSANVERHAGSVVGFPRDSWVEASYGFDKFTHVNALSDRNSEEMVDIAERISGLDIDGYIVTGFGGFMHLMNAFGGVVVNVPFSMADEKSNAFLSAGIQRLFGEDALAFSRNRHLNGGDFTRSKHQGLVILGALGEILQGDVSDVPALLAILQDYTWTNLSLGDLLNLAVIAYQMDPVQITNIVLPGTAGTAAGGAAVVFLDEDRVAEIFDDLRDGVLDG